MYRIVRILLPLILLTAGFAAFKGLQATRPEPPAAEVGERVWRVAVRAVEPGARAPELLLYGRVETADLLRAAASAPARVAVVPVREGHRVARGELLVRLDERDLVPRLRQAEADAAELEAQIRSEEIRFGTDQAALLEEQKLLQIARNALERAQRLRSQRVAAESDLDAAEEAVARQALAVRTREMAIADHPARLEALRARLERARANLAEVELEVARAEVVAPYDGVIAAVEVTVGDQVKRDDVLVRIYSVESLEIRARVPAPYQEEIRAALAAGEPLTAVALSGAREIPLRLERLAGEAHPSGLDALFAVTGDPEALRLGQMLSVRLVRPARPDAVAVPFEAVYGGDRIYRVDAGGRMRGVPVEVLGGALNGDGEEDLLVRSSELSTGDRIVVTHMPNAVDGLRVEVVQ